VNRRFLFVVALLCVLPLSFAAGCGSKCDDYQEQLTQCENRYCASTEANPAVCSCWALGMDVNIATCTCIPMLWDTLCGMMENFNVEPDQVMGFCPSFAAGLDGICRE
jgi:hypothetical protein